MNIEIKDNHITDQIVIDKLYWKHILKVYNIKNVTYLLKILLLM